MLNSILSNILALINTIDENYSNLLGIHDPFFRSTHLNIKVKKDSEYTFIRSVSWFFSLFTERGSQNFSYLKSKVSFKCKFEIEFIYLLTILRTYFQHSLDHTRISDLEKINTVSEFFEIVLEKDFPISNQDWFKCNQVLYECIFQYLKLLNNYIEDIEKDDFKDIIVTEWLMYKDSKIDLETVKDIFRTECKKLDLTFYDVNKLSEKNYDKWMKDIKVLRLENIDQMKSSLTKIIQSELIRYEHLPIDGNDIMNHFSIEPSEQVRIKLEEARKIFATSPCSKEDLLKKIT